MDRRVKYEKNIGLILVSLITNAKKRCNISSYYLTVSFSSLNEKSSDVRYKLWNNSYN